MKVTYIEEANELLGSLENALLALEDNPGDKSYIEQVFRVMHTLKGNSSMFGLAVITEFVHDLETIYDKIRSGEMLLSKDLLNCTLLSLDHLKIIIHDTDLNDQHNKKSHENLIREIRKFTHDPASKPEAADGRQNTDVSAIKTFHIYFEPNTKIFDDGSNPLYLVNELHGLGKAKSIPHFKVNKSFAEFNPSDCITYWDIFLETEHDEKTIMDVFVFVEQNAVIKIKEITFSSLLSNPKFLDKISENIFEDCKIEDEKLMQLAETFGKKISYAPVPAEEQTLQEKEVSERKTSSTEKINSSIRVSSEKLDELMRLVSELVTTQASLSLFTENNKINELETISENVEKLSRRLRDIAFGMTLVPINNMFGRFNRMVRDISNLLGKEVDFITEGGETELDKTIIETLTDPLMHLLRNSLDHGIETADERIRKGKQRRGKVTLKAYYSGVFVYIQISDDGKGINPDAIRNKAIQKGIIGPDDVLNEKEIYDLIFYPGFSTAEAITDVSGRGVGMDVVKKNITDLKGSVLISSRVNEGTTLTIKLPLTLSIIDGLLVVIENVHFVIPLSVVTKCYEVNNNEMHDNFHQLLILDGEQVPFINLRKEFSYDSQPPELSQIIVVSDETTKVGISVDAIVGEYQAVVKPIGRYYRNQDFVSGATILGDGTIALVLDTHKIIELYCENVKMEEKI